MVNDTVAWARALAELRGRNVDWAIEAVENSVSITASEAVDEGVVELVAKDLDDLLGQLQGREVSTLAGTVTLNTAGAGVRAIPIWWGERVLTMIAQPNVAFLLMIFGFYGILFELYSPGWGVSGTLGVVCIVLAMFGLAVLPVNHLGLALVAIALGLMVAEVFVTSYGALAVAGAACLVVGGVMLVDSPGGFARVSLGVLLPVSLATMVITLLLVGGIIRSHRAPVTTGAEGLMGRRGRVIDDFRRHNDSYQGTVAIHGERWRAVSQQPLKGDDVCQVTGREGLTLTVEPTQINR
jgi:membrane-bound serine protease (ClpP class)